MEQKREKSKQKGEREDKRSKKPTEPNVDVSLLPQDIRDKLAELELELSEGKTKYFLQLHSFLHIYSIVK